MDITRRHPIERSSILPAVLLLLLGFAAPARASQDDPRLRVSISVDPAVRSEPVTGRVFFLISDRERPEPRLTMPYTFAYYMNTPGLPYVPLFGVDVEALQPGSAVVIDAETLGYPFASLRDVPAGDYTVQAVLHVYTRFERADGHVVWMPMDQWEGQQFHISPGNLVSDPQEVRLDAREGFDVELSLTRVIPPIEPRPDSQYVKRIKIRSNLVSEFWGHDMYMGATVLLPEGYDEHPDVYYPVLYYQGHFFESEPLGFPMRLGFRQAWLSDDFPRMIVVTFQHPTPFYDDSYAVNSLNNGPWGDAFMTELIPYVEENFRIIRKAYARVMTGGSTGGWVSAALQIYHPDFFGGAWSFCPDPVDFREFLNVDIYRDESAFSAPGRRWLVPERFASRSVKGQPRVSVRQISQLSAVLGSKGRSGEFVDMWCAIYGPVGPDGYPPAIWDHETGEIDREVAEYWRDNGWDLRHYLQTHWSEIGPDLVGKLHFGCGDMDNFYLNLAMYRMEEFLEGTSDPHYGGSFVWGRPMVGHTIYGYDPYPMALLETMAEHITANAPEGENPASWRY